MVLILVGIAGTRLRKTTMTIVMNKDEVSSNDESLGDEVAADTSSTSKLTPPVCTTDSKGQPGVLDKFLTG